jgi:hypothetical protein
VTEPVLRLRRRIVLDGLVVGWVAKRGHRHYRAYIERPGGGYLAAEGHTRREAMNEVWSARCVLHSVCKETTEERQ